MSDRLANLFARAGLLTSDDCLRCDVCCRFPEAMSGLAPWFGQAEIARATDAGFDAAALPPGHYGPGHAALLTPTDPYYACPSFRPERNGCDIYAQRPLDCRLYPFMLMLDAEGRSVSLGLDSYCPVMQERRTTPGFEAFVTELAALLEGDLAGEVLACRGIITEFKDHIEPLKPLPRLTRAHCRSDLGLARFVDTAEPTLRPLFESHGGRLSSHAFATLAAWNSVFDMHVKVSGERLLIFAQEDGDCFLIAPPLGTGDVAGPAQEALEIMRRLAPEAPSPRIQEADKPLRDALVAAGWCVRDETVEYVYRRSDLADLAGRAFEKKRQMCNRFERDHAWAWRPMADDDFPAAMVLYRDWIARRSAAHPNPFYTAQAEASFRFAYRVLRDAAALGVTTRVLEADGRMAGVTAGVGLPDGRTLHVMLEVADLNVRGAAQFMYREFCREMSGMDFINAGGDSGLPNLGRVKESYRPCARLPAAVLRPSDGR